MPSASGLLTVADRFLEASSTAQKWRVLNATETRLQRGIAAAFDAQGGAFAEEFATLRDKFEEARLREAIVEGDWLNLFRNVAVSTLPLFANPIEDAVQTAMTAAATELVADFAIDYTFSLRNPRAAAYVQEHGAELVRGIDDTTRGYLKTLIDQGVSEGWSHQRMSDAITERYSEFARGVPQRHIQSRAHLIAVTESGNAYEAGNEVVIRDLQDAGLKMEKQWLTVGDNRVSQGCQDNQAEGWIPVSQAFPSGHQRPLRFPGCRCTVQYRRMRGEGGGAIR